MSRDRHSSPSTSRMARVVTGGAAVVGMATGSLLVATPAQAHVEPGTTTPPVTTGEVTPAQAPTTPVAPSTVEVQPGDTLSGIGARVDEPWHTLYSDNVAVIGSDPNRIFPGQQLALASSVAPAPVVPSSPVPVAQSTPALVVSGRHAAAVDGAQVVADAEHYLGVPYVWGGSTPAGFDCSGLVQYVYRDLGIALPRTAEAQSGVGTPVASLADAQPGDLLFFYSPISHVAIYAGNGQMVDAETEGTPVRLTSVWATPVAIRRVL